jgi:hypothetical protein
LGGAEGRGEGSEGCEGGLGVGREEGHVGAVEDGVYEGGVADAEVAAGCEDCDDEAGGCQNVSAPASTVDGESSRLR